MEFQKNSKILNLQSRGTNTNSNFMCDYCVRKNDFNYFLPPQFPYIHYPPSNFGGKLYQNENSEQCNSCSKSENGLNGSFFSPFPIYLPFFYNPVANMSTNNSCKQCSKNSNCSQSTQTHEDVLVQSNEIICEKKSKLKLNFEHTNVVFSKRPSYEDNRNGKSNQQQDRGDNFEESEYNKNDKNDKSIRICEGKNCYYEKQNSSSEDNDPYIENDENENQMDNLNQKVKNHRNDGQKFCPPAQNDTAALCMLSLLTRHKAVIDMAQPSLFPQIKVDSPSRLIKRSELKENSSENYVMSPVRNNNIHKVPSVLQQNDHLKAVSPRSLVKLRTNPNLNI